MRSAIVAAAFAAGVLAVPYKRDLVTDWDIVYETDIVTVWATAVETDSAAETTTTASAYAHYGHNHWSHWSHSEAAAPTTSSESSVEAITTSTTEIATSTPEPTTSTEVETTSSSIYVPPPVTSTYVPPPVTSTSEAPVTIPSSTYVAPVTYPSSTSVAPSSTWAPASSAAPDLSVYSNAVVYHHNIHRANHSAVDLEWSADLAKSAQDIAASCVYAHNTEMDGGGYGQNIAAGVKGDNISAIITDLFYNGEVNWFTGLYGQAQPDMTNFEHWGHFSQIVWNSTTSVGCYTQDCSSGGLGNVGGDVAPFFTVCNYGPPGNYANEYKANIGYSLNKATQEWNAGQ